MVESNSSVFRACTTWKHPTRGKDWKRTDNLTGVRCSWELGTQQGCSASRKRDLSHSWNTCLCSVSMSTLWYHQHALQENVGFVTCLLLVGFMGLGVLTQSLCFYQSPIADLWLTWKEIFKKTAVVHVAWERPTVIVGGAGVNEEGYKESEYKVKLYFLDALIFIQNTLSIDSVWSQGNFHCVWLRYIRLF